MSRVPARKFLRPKVVNVGRGDEPAKIQIPDTKKLLPVDGAEVSMAGRAGSYWLRRISEGSVEEVKQPEIKPEPKSKKGAAE